MSSPLHQVDQWIKDDKVMPFASGWEHIEHEIRRIDLLIRIALIRYPPQVSAEIEQYKGLFISEEEVWSLLEVYKSPEQLEPIEQLLHMLTAWEQYIAKRLELSRQQGIHTPLDQIRQRMKLEDHSYLCFLVVLAIEIDRKYEKLYAYLQDDITCKSPTLQLLLKLLADQPEHVQRIRQAFGTRHPLTDWLIHPLVESEPKSSLSRAWIVEPDVMQFLLEEQVEQHSFSAKGLRLYQPDDELPPLIIHQSIQQQLQLIWQHQSDQTVVLIHGRVGSGKKHQLRHLCQCYHRSMLVADLERIESSSSEKIQEWIQKTLRQAMLRDAVLVCTGWDQWLQRTPTEIQYVVRELEQYKGILFLIANTMQDMYLTTTLWSLEQEIQLSMPSIQESLLIWEYYGNQKWTEHSLNWQQAASTFQMTAGQIVKALADMATEYTLNSDHTTADQTLELTQEHLNRSCYRQIQTRLNTQATRLSITATWDDLILPVSQKQRMRYACDQVKYRSKVYEEWGFGHKLAYGKGLSLLFTGPPGTGKTMSARVIANELQMQMYQINLSQVVSKYIGETEKHLQEVFDEAKYSSSILFFDEADALFGKRSEVSDSHDKFANMETSFLLQKMEEYEGITVLATNYKQNLDEAFMRRISFIIRFPFPNKESRQQIWRTLLPDQVPIEKGIDFDFLGDTFEISGGQIKNVLVASAFLAASEQVPLSMKMIFTALRQELDKSGMVPSTTSLGLYSDLWQ
ncbi:ATP-binding protein [Paenibacillus nuruki]|uniref:ATP-binding protein n=1 Tax=Paenibacillus nuruki TaxID=1886670 RepID=UPI002805E59D|nr:AAA family ATPase [Paenibacillus nuruki]